jgi:hypothetical protein
MMTFALKSPVSIAGVDIYYLGEDETNEPGWYFDLEFTDGLSDSFGPYESRNAAKRSAYGG